MKDLLERISRLSPEKRAHLEQMLEEKGVHATSRKGIQRVEGRKSAPLSFAQERTWFLDQLTSDKTIYNRPVAVLLRGLLNAAALEQTINEIIRRHEILRTTFVALDGDPVQIVHHAEPLKVARVDLRQLPEGDRIAEATRLITECMRQRFDVGQGPLLRGSLLRLGDEEHILSITLHHILFDNWSMNVFLREVAALYEAFSAGKLSPLPDLPIQSVDFAVWQRQWLQGDVLERKLFYWKRQLGEDLPVLELMTDYPRPAIQTYRAGHSTLQLSGELTGSLKALSLREGVTLFMTVLAAFKVLLSRYTGKDDIVIGTPVANRNMVEIENLIGFFVNTLVLRTDFSGNPTFREILNRIRQVALEAYANQDLPFEKLVEELRPERNLSHSPLFQVMLNMENTPKQPLVAQGLRIEEFEVLSDIAPLDLSLEMTEKGSGICCLFVYNADLFDAATIGRMAGHYRTILEGVVANPDLKLSELPLLTEEERHQLLVQWNDTKTEYPRDKCIHELFEEQVERTPDTMAVVFEGRHLTYGELDARANQLAHTLRKRGVGPEVLVGICVERSLEMVVGVLGILKAGGAYVPLDPEYPRKRLAFMVEDSRPLVLVTQRNLIHQLPEYRSQAVFLDADRGAVARESRENIISGVHTYNLAYVIYTSGTTGRPKGVLIEHRQVINYVMGFKAETRLDRGTRYAMLQPLTFDSSFTVLFPSLLTGGCLHLISESRALDSHALHTHFQENQIDCLKITPTHMAALEGSLSGSHILPRGCLVIGGETSRREWINELEAASPGCTIFNHYGPTETTVGVLMYRVSEDLSHQRSILPLGRPLSNVRVYLLDCHLNPVPIGAIGELYIGGDCLARGYLNRPDLTAERFIPDPFSGRVGRLYKTGDLGRYLPDGNIEFCGRVDDQVKIRGYRVELKEIEVILARHESVADSIVVAREYAPGDRRLVAYVVCREGQKFDAEQLRWHAKRELPHYMIPSLFVPLKALPQTSHGKVDRRALPAPDPKWSDSDGSYAGARTPIEKLLAGIWGEVLKLDRVGIHDDFFELGGDSLSAVRIIGRVREVFGLKLSFVDVFETPSVSMLAAHIARAGINSPGTLPVPARVCSRSRIPLSCGQRDIWFLVQLFPNVPVYNEPLTIYFPGLIDPIALEWAFNQIIRRHEILRTAFTMEDLLPGHAILEDVPLMLRVDDLRSIPIADRETEALRRATEEARRPLDLGAPPLFRAMLVRFNDSESRLYMVFHHIVTDAFSIYRVLLPELWMYYDAARNERVSSMDAMPVQYVDYMKWQYEWLQGPVLNEHLAYWKAQLDGAQSLELPTDRPRPLLRTFRGAFQKINFSGELTWQLKAVGRREGATLNMVLLAAFKVLLWRYTRQDDIVVGTAEAGRTRSEFESLMGCFLNLLVIRTDLSGNPSFREFLRQVRRVSAEAYTHKDLPFAALVEALNLPRDQARHPLFQVAFTMEPSLPDYESGWTVSQLEVQTGTAKFDLTLEMEVRTGCLIGRFEYSTDLFDAATIERMAGHYRMILEGIVANPDLRLSELPLLTEAERHKFLVEWNETKAEYPRDKCIHELFEEQVERGPDVTAVVFEGRQLTYGELNARANQLAHTLRGRGVGPEVLVGICMERCPEMVVGILGILKAGGAYVPLDPEYPKERLAFMVEDSCPALLVTQRNLIDHLPEYKSHAIVLDADLGAVAHESSENIISGVHTDNLAYVIYTSGSTGEPKGVLLEHNGVINVSEAQVRAFRLKQGDRVLQFASMSFDASIFEIIMALCAGATLCLARREDLLPGPDLMRVLRDLSVTIFILPPSVLEYLTPEGLPDLRIITVGGEVCNGGLVRRWAKGRRFFNLYGPTEATIVATMAECVNDTDPVPIGRPLSGRAVYIVDRDLNPLPVGVPGELCIGGDGLARGYLKRPELTAEKFIRNPFSDEPGARLYKTGDLARYRIDGSIEFLGRIDRQVKIHGFRIELGEIEAALCAHPGVRDAVVVVHGDDSSHKQLVAYVVPFRLQSAAALGPKPYRLPNNLMLGHLNKNETDYLYREIFELQAYLRHGITVNEGDIVFDVGANIGLFTMFVTQLSRRTRIYAFEPNPIVYKILSANTAFHARDAKLFNCGLSKSEGMAELTFFKGFSFLSGFYADPIMEKSVVKTFLHNLQKTGKEGTADLIEHADELLDERFKACSFEVRLRTLSGVIADEKVERIDLLKINVEKSEWDVLQGILDEDWKRIQQVVLEVDLKENLPVIVSLLERHGFELVVKQDALLDQTPLCYVYAIRPTPDRRLIREQRAGAHLRTLPAGEDAVVSLPDLGRFLRKRLPHYLIPSAFMRMDALPLTTSGKIDRTALPVPDMEKPDRESSYVGPRTPVEVLLADIWCEALGLKHIGVHDDFFAMGGHSLLATRIISRVRHAFETDLPLRCLFESPTVEGLARILLDTEGEREKIEKRAELILKVSGLSDDEANIMISEKKNNME